jgi:hypothetical protein
MRLALMGLLFGVAFPIVSPLEITHSRPFTQNEGLMEATPTAESVVGTIATPIPSFITVATPDPAPIEQRLRNLEDRLSEQERRIQAFGTPTSGEAASNQPADNSGSSGPPTAWVGFLGAILGAIIGGLASVYATGMLMRSSLLAGWAQQVRARLSAIRAIRLEMAANMDTIDQALADPPILVPLQVKGMTGTFHETIAQLPTETSEALTKAMLLAHRYNSTLTQLASLKSVDQSRSHADVPVTAEAIRIARLAREAIAETLPLVDAYLVSQQAEEQLLQQRIDEGARRHLLRQRWWQRLWPF